ncbi:MAG: hypothetical protein JMHAAFGB_00621 [Dehalococcoides mccartyi]|nr:hypothetical protein [Dehalococcoides mccartyi]MEA2122487.1 hypothetical protein [Dehalococcoides mccartyi]
MGFTRTARAAENQPAGGFRSKVQGGIVSLAEHILVMRFFAFTQRIQLFKGVFLQTSQTAIGQQPFFPVRTGFGLGALAGDYPAKIRYPFGGNRVHELCPFT